MNKTFYEAKTHFMCQKLNLLTIQSCKWNLPKTWPKTNYFFHDKSLHMLTRFSESANLQKNGLTIIFMVTVWFLWKCYVRSEWTRRLILSRSTRRFPNDVAVRVARQFATWHPIQVMWQNFLLPAAVKENFPPPLNVSKQTSGHGGQRGRGVVQPNTGTEGSR